MSTLGGVVRAGVRRRRTQTIVTVIATFTAVTSAVLGLTLLHASSAPFEQAFAQQRGAHLTAAFTSSATAAELQATATMHGVTAVAGPFPTATATPSFHPGADAPPGTPATITLPPTTFVGRAQADEPVDQITIDHGRWATAAGEVVVEADGNDLPDEIGATLSFPDLPETPTLTIVGIARSISRTADAWVTPAEITALTSGSLPTGEQMLYRFTHASTTSDMATNRTAIATAAGQPSITGTQSWLDVKQTADRDAALFVPFLIAFGALGLVMSMLVVGGVVAGAVSSSVHRIGILKTLGFTPGQIVRAYTAQALLPAALGIAAGVAAGCALTQPVLSTTNQLYGTTTSSINPAIDLTVTLAALTVAAATAIAASWRGGRMSAVDALSTGRTPQAGRGQTAARLSGRLPLPRPVTLGLAHPFARPARTVALTLAVVFGVTSVTFAVGIANSLAAVQRAKAHDNSDVTVPTNGTAFGPKQINRDGSTPQNTTAADVSGIAAAIANQPGTSQSFAVSSTDIAIPGLAGTTTVDAFEGDASWAGYALVSGHWLTQPGDAVVTRTFMQSTNTTLGDTVTLADHGATIEIHLVGEVFDPHSETMEILTDQQTLGPADPDLIPDTFSIKLAHGTDIATYLTALNSNLQPFGVNAASSASTRNGSDQIVALQTLTAALTLTLIVVAALGVLNSVVLDTRDRVHDIGVHKALGMTPRQTIAMITASVMVVGLIGGAIGVPIGMFVHHLVLPAMGHAAGVRLPASVLAVYRFPETALLAAGGLAIALLGATLPAKWAASTRAVNALRAE
jgi:putative ABC transport system permease protein